MFDADGASHVVNVLQTDSHSAVAVKNASGLESAAAADTLVGELTASNFEVALEGQSGGGA